MRAEDKICLECGGEGRLIQVSLTEEIKIGDCLEGSLKEKSNKDKVEFTEGVRTQRDPLKCNDWIKISQRIDRRNDTYKEKITDIQTGEIINECEEPLSKHWGHGSDKNRKKE